MKFDSDIRCVIAKAIKDGWVELEEVVIPIDQYNNRFDMVQERLNKTVNRLAENIGISATDRRLRCRQTTLGKDYYVYTYTFDMDAR